jgi:hypothetical protein
VPTLDIPVKPNLQKALDLKPCSAFALPAPKPLKLQVPGGGTIKAVNDLSQGIPNDCTMGFNLMLQLGPLLGALDCPLKILALLEPLVSVIMGVAKVPPDIPSKKTVDKITKAVADLAPCFLAVTPVGMFPVVKDILCLIRAVLLCVLQQIKSIRDLMQGLSLRLEEAAGNDDLLAQLQCAQDNADNAMQNMTQAIEPITALLAVVGPLLKIAQLPEIKLELEGSPEGAEGLTKVVDTLQAVVDLIDEVLGPVCG